MKTSVKQFKFSSSAIEITNVFNLFCFNKIMDYIGVLWCSSTGDPNLAALKAEQAAAANANSNNSDQSNQTPVPQEETTPRGLNNWREATARAHTSAQLAMALYMLEASIAWDKSIMKAVSLTPARNSVCVKLRNRCVSLKATNQYNQLLTTSQASVGIRTNFTNQANPLFPCVIKTLSPVPHSEPQRAYRF